MITLILLASLLVIYFLFFFFWVWTLIKGAPFYPSNKKIIQEIVDFVKKQKNPQVVDLGSGDGRIVLALARENIPVTGIDVNPFLTLFSKLKLFLGKCRNAKIINADIFHTDLSGYNVVVCYLFPEIMHKLEDKFYRELPKGAYIITNTFSLKHHKPLIAKGKLLIYQVS